MNEVIFQNSMYIDGCRYSELFRQIFDYFRGSRLRTLCQPIYDWACSLRYAFKKKITYNETLSYLGGESKGRGSKRNPIILHLINGTLIMGGRGSEFFVSCLILKKTTQKGDVEGFQTTCSMWLRHLITDGKLILCTC